MSSNLTSVFLCTKYSIPYLEKSKSGVIVNVASRLGFTEVYGEKFIPYSAAKAGVIKFTLNAAKELSSRNIRVNVIIPTVTKTELIGKLFTKEEIELFERESRLGTPDDAANLAIELIDDLSASGKILTDKRVKTK